jgi:hypothetical protein
LAARLSGAIFTTTPDGGIVNENVHYASKLEVYLDGGPPPNAPVSAAGLPAGLYVFQVTDPSGKVLLSEDPTKCRIVEVSADGVIIRLVEPSELGLSCPTIKYRGKLITIECHIQDEPDGVAGPSGRHDTNTDIDHGSDADAIVVQLMPFLDTPNPGGVYKAWMIPLERYEANGGNLDIMPKDRGSVKKKGDTLGFKPDPGFGPPRDQIKTDNFKVKELIPPATLSVQKFNDVNANMIWDEGEPEIGVDEFINGGGWPLQIFDPLNITTWPYTPFEIVSAPEGNYLVTELGVSGWQQSAASLDGEFLGTDLATVAVVVLGTPGEHHEVVFGNFMPAEIHGKKFNDLDGDGEWDAGEPGVEGVEIRLDGLDGMGVEVHLVTWTGSDGSFSFIELVASTPTFKDLTLESGDVIQLGYVFGNYEPADIYGKKFNDLDGDGEWDVGEPGVEGVEITLTGTEGDGDPVSMTTWTDANGAFCFMDLAPGTYTVTEIVPAGSVASTPTFKDLTLESGDVIQLGYVFGNYVPVDIYAHKFYDFNENGVQDPFEEDLEGIKICLTLDGAPVTEDAYGNPIDSCQFTDGEGNLSWTDLKPGSYLVSEDLAGSLIIGLFPTTPTDVPVVIISGDDPVTVEFGNVGGPCYGLTPGYWKNWRNHYTPDEFAFLLEGTIAGSIAEADQIFEHWDASDPSDLTILKAFTLANQLTLNLTQNPGLPNPSGGNIFNACLIQYNGEWWSLGDALSEALLMIANVSAYEDDDILEIKTILDIFANMTP